MDFKKLEKDFDEVVYGEILNELEKSPEEMEGEFRCHDFAYLIRHGMKKKGYNTKIKHGIYFDFHNNVYHSWNELNKIILDYHNYLRYCYGTSEIWFSKEILKKPIIDIRFVKVYQKQEPDSGIKAIYITRPNYKPEPSDSAKGLARKLFDV